MKSLFILCIFMSSYLFRAHSSPVNISPAAVASLQALFKGAKDVSWSKMNELYRAKFKYNDQLTYAFYNEQGNLVCIGRKLELKQLPFVLQVDLQKKLKQYNVTDLFELSGDKGHKYYVTIANENVEVILSATSNRWQTYQKTKKRLR